MTRSERNQPKPLLRASIIIVSYNSKTKLLACLASICSHLTPEYEVVVVDNASSEGNADAVEEAFPGVSLIRSDENLGFAGGCNLGAKKSSGKFLVFINPDTIVEQGWLDALVAPLERGEQIGLTTGRILLL